MLIPRRVITHTNCFFALPQEVFCHTTSQTEAILQLHTVDLGDTGLSHISWLSAMCFFCLCLCLQKFSQVSLFHGKPKKWSRVESRITHKHLRHRMFEFILILPFFQFGLLSYWPIILSSWWFETVSIFTPKIGEMIQVDSWAGHEMVEFEIQKMGLDLKSWRTTKNRYSESATWNVIHVYTCICIFGKYILYLCISIFIIHIYTYIWNYQSHKIIWWYALIYWYRFVPEILPHSTVELLSELHQSSLRNVGWSFSRESLPMGPIKGIIRVCERYIYNIKLLYPPSN